MRFCVIFWYVISEIYILTCGIEVIYFLYDKAGFLSFRNMVLIVSIATKKKSVFQARVRNKHDKNASEPVAKTLKSPQSF